MRTGASIAGSPLRLTVVSACTPWSSKSPRPAPVWILDLYAGQGVGTFYYDAEASGAVSASDEGFLLGGNAFLGATINLADRIALGLEGKYYVTDEISDLDAGLDAFALMRTLGFSR